jgi:hypothetical protein
MAEIKYGNSPLASARHAHRAWLRSVFSLVRPDIRRDTVATRDKKVARRLFPHCVCVTVSLNVFPCEQFELAAGLCGNIRSGCDNGVF